MSNSLADDLLPEYDLDYSKSKSNRFAAQAGNLVELDPQIATWLRVRAADKGVELSDLVNELLQRDIDLVEAVQ
ncbi:MAG TPA: hypothetical protein VES73_12200 [Lamprocystis sp. (in: g-proteobacteria)]|nr:hypothetical protein [Lamprocystis sp. (in: g-proteobacteria)]